MEKNPLQGPYEVNSLKKRCLEGSTIAKKLGLRVSFVFNAFFAGKLP